MEASSVLFLGSSHTNSNCSQTNRRIGHCTLANPVLKPKVCRRPGSCRFITTCISCSKEYLELTDFSEGLSQMPLPTINIKSHNTDTMLTRFITSQCDHGGYLCMGTNNSLSLQHLRPPLVSRGRPRESCPRDYSSLSSFFPRPPCLSPTLPLQSPSTRGTTKRKMESRAQLSQQHRSQTPALKTSIFPSGVVLGHQPTCLPNSICMQSTTTEGVPVAEGLPEETNGNGDSRKNDRDRITLTTGNS